MCKAQQPFACREADCPIFLQLFMLCKVCFELCTKSLNKIESQIGKGPQNRKVTKCWPIWVQACRNALFNKKIIARDTGHLAGLHGSYGQPFRYYFKAAKSGHFSILRCLMPDDFTCQGRISSSGGG